jgi:hypothetical protein
LKTTWDGFNDPKGSHPAAVKNCIECGWAPGRAPECTKSLDGNFGCCLTGSRYDDLAINRLNRRVRQEVVEVQVVKQLM